MTTASEISPDDHHPAQRELTEQDQSELDICSVDISMCSTRGGASQQDPKLNKNAPMFKPNAYFKPEKQV